LAVAPKASRHEPGRQITVAVLADAEDAILRPIAN
jgi:hypothetical protein